MSGPRGFAVRVFTVRLARCESLTGLTIRPAVILRAGAVASTTFRPAFVTIAIRPLPGRNGALKPLIGVVGKVNIFAIAAGRPKSD